MNSLTNLLKSLGTVNQMTANMSTGVEVTNNWAVFTFEMPGGEEFNIECGFDDDWNALFYSQNVPHQSMRAALNRHHAYDNEWATERDYDLHTYRVKVTEELTHEFTVEAKSEESARAIAEAQRGNATLTACTDLDIVVGLKA